MMMGPMMGSIWNWGNVGWGWMVAGWISMIAFWGAIIWLIFWTISRLTQGQRPSGAGQAPLDIAKARYARGEITREQYEQLRRDLV